MPDAPKPPSPIRPGARPTPLPAGALPPEAASAPPAARWGKYIRVRKIGFGGMGEVYKAWDLELTRWVALKVLVGRDDEDLARFRREAQLAARISHPNIAPIHEISNHEGHPYIAMQFIEGTTLRSVPRTDRRAIVRAVRDAAQALHAAHLNGTVHRDLKPENLMVQEVSGPRGQPEWHLFIMDFGLARTAGAASTISHAGDVLGTPSYMPPEQARGEKVDGRADIYSLGATLYDLLTGKRVFEDETFMGMISKILEEPPKPPRQIDPTIDDDLQAIVLRCLEKAPAMRYPDAGQLAADLDRWLAGEPVSTRPPSAPDRIRRWSGRHQVAILLTVLVLAVGPAAAFYVFGREAETNRLAREAEMLRREREGAEARARSHLVLARRGIEQMRLLMRETAYDVPALKTLRDGVVSDAERASGAAPFLAEPHYQVGLAQLLAGDEDAAIAAFDRALKVSPDFVPAMLTRLRIRAEDYEHKKHNKAPETPEDAAGRAALEADLASVRRLAAGASERLYADGLLAFSRGDYPEAEARIGDHLKVSPGDAKAHAVRAHALWHLRRYDESLAEATLAVNADTRLSVGWNQIGLCRKAKGDLPAAIAAYDQAIRFNPRSHNYWLNRGRAREDGGDHDGALADMNEAIKRKADDPSMYNSRGIVYLRMKKWKEATAEFDAALRLDPRMVEAHHNKGMSAYRQQDYPAALASFQTATTVDPGYGLSWHYRGLTKGRMKDHAGAVADLTESILLGHDLADSYYNRGVSYWAMQDAERAAADLRKALDVAPPAWDNRSRCEQLLKKVNP